MLPFLYSVFCVSILVVALIGYICQMWEACGMSGVWNEEKNTRFTVPLLTVPTIHCSIQLLSHRCLTCQVVLCNGCQPGWENKLVLLHSLPIVKLRTLFG